MPNVKINAMAAEFKKVRANKYNNVVKFNNGKFPNSVTLSNSTFSRYWFKN